MHKSISPAPIAVAIDGVPFTVDPRIEYGDDDLVVKARPDLFERVGPAPAAKRTARKKAAPKKTED